MLNNFKITDIFLSKNKKISTIINNCNTIDLEQDINLLETLTKIYKDNPKILYNLAYLYSAQNKINEATKIYQEAYKLDTDFINNCSIKLLPRYIQIESVRACNAACVMCPLVTSPTPNKVMSDKVFEKILDDINQIKGYDPHIALYGLNEPLIDKKIYKRIKRLRQIGISNVSIQSNGALLNKTKSTKLIESGLTGIGFSIESLNKKNYEEIRKNLNIEDTLRGIDDFINVRNKISKDLPINIFFTYSNINKDEYSEYRKFWKNKLKKGLDNIMLLPIHSFYKFDLYSQIENKACYQIFTDMHIRADGKLSLCCIDVESEFSVGNINKENIFDLYNNDKIKTDRHKHLTMKRTEMSICKRCDQPESADKLYVDNLQNKSPRLVDNYFV